MVFKATPLFSHPVDIIVRQNNPMSTKEIPTPRVSLSRQIFIAPTCLVFTYLVLLSLPEEIGLPASKLVLATLVYLALIWWRNILGIVQNVSGDTRNERMFLLSGMAIFALAWIVIHFIYDNQIVMQRLFTIGPAVIGLHWLVFRNVQEVQTRKGLWRWWRLNSPRFRSFAASIYAISFLARGALNEVFISFENDLLWVLSCAFLPIAIRWIADNAIIRGLIKRGAEVRPKSSI